MYALLRGSSDGQSGYYYYNDSAEAIKDSIIGLCVDIINDYCDTEYSPEDLIDCEEDSEEAETYYDGYYFELSDLIAIVDGSGDLEEGFSFCFGDQNIDLLIATEDETKLYKVCAEIDKELVENMSGEEAAEAIVDKYSTWL